MIPYLLGEGQSLDTWITTWKWVVVGAVVVFGAMGLIVGTGAIRDALSMFRDLSGKDRPERD